RPGSLVVTCGVRRYDRQRCRIARAGAIAILLVHAAAPRLVEAGGGPRNVLVVANQNSEESLEVASYYLRARGLPDANLCRIQATTALATDKATYQTQIEAPILA